MVDLSSPRLCRHLYSFSPFVFVFIYNYFFMSKIYLSTHAVFAVIKVFSSQDKFAKKPSYVLYVQVSNPYLLRLLFLLF